MQCRRYAIAGVLGLLCLGWLGGSQGLAVLFRDTANPGVNTNAPTGMLTNSGWQWQGRWGGFLGTPIAPTFFVTAKHVGGSTNQTFVLNGFAYHPVGRTNCPNADLTVWQVAETFPSYAPLYTDTNEVGQHCVVFGRGTLRGTAVIVEGVTNGWRWGSVDGVQRWGENDIASVENLGTGIGQTLRATFDRAGGSNECHLSVGDSSGAMFIQDGATWKLAGIHYAVDGYFSPDGTTNTQFDAALLDMGGWYSGSGTDWTLVTNQVADVPSGFYSTRISTNRNWLASVINFQPGPDLRIQSIQRTGADILITLATGSNRQYRIESATDLLAGDWLPLTNNVAGTGGPVTIIDAGAATNFTQRFYRAAIAP
jgi:hypothetical protein